MGLNKDRSQPVLFLSLGNESEKCSQALAVQPAALFPWKLARFHLSWFGLTMIVVQKGRNGVRQKLPLVKHSFFLSVLFCLFSSNRRNKHIKYVGSLFIRKMQIKTNTHPVMAII